MTSVTGARDRRTASRVATSNGGRERCPRLLRATLGAALSCLAAAGLASCYEDEIGTPLSIELIGPDAGLVDQKLSVLYNVSGRSLNGIIFNWGDGTVDSLATAGAQKASGDREHTYQSTGLFTVRARAEDAVEGVASAEITINIQWSQE